MLEQQLSQISIYFFVYISCNKRYINHNDVKIFLLRDLGFFLFYRLDECYRKLYILCAQVFHATSFFNNDL